MTDQNTPFKNVTDQNTLFTNITNQNTFKKNDQSEHFSLKLTDQNTLSKIWPIRTLFSKR